jgi:hypothetical protein
MCEFSQTNGRENPPTGRKPKLPLGGVFCLGWAVAAAGLLLAQSGVAQTLRLGPFDLSVTAKGEVGYDSNVDDVYPEDEDPLLKKGDFYWMPGLIIRSKPTAMSPRTTLNLSAGLAYMDYFERDDLDTELYNASLNFQTVLPRLTLGGMASTEYSVDASQDQYVPGGVSRDPALTDEANVFAKWNYRKFRLETRADYIRERHDSIEYQVGDKDESTLFAGAFLDLFTWGSLFYSWEEKVTTLVQTGEETDETTKSFGLAGSIPLSWLAHPKITYAFGVTSDEKSSDTNGPTWEPTHTITVSDELHLSKTVNLSGSATWQNTVRDSDVSFVYNVMLEQLLGARARHALTFTQEPEPTFGSTTDTKTTTYGYNFMVRDLFIYNLSLGFGAAYEESTPLGDAEALTEKTTRLNFGLTHTRLLSRRLSRIIAYTYTSENSNFHDDGPTQKHLITYGFTYDF